MISISEKAAKHINHIRSEEGENAKQFLRVFVETGGCSGFNYKLDFDDSSNDSDQLFESHGCKVIVDKKSLLYLVGMTLDYEGGLNGQGFVFSNPNAKKTCSCGSSFGV